MIGSYMMYKPSHDNTTEKTNEWQTNIVGALVDITTSVAK